MACSREIDAWKETTNLILTAKREKKLTWDTLAAQLGCNPCFLCSVCLGENLIDKEKAGRLCTILDIPSVPTVQVLSSFHPLKGQKKWDEILHDPVLYRLHEINCIYGTTIKEIIHEKFGDGIMSAIDFELDINKVQDPQGYDRVNITLSGKFLNYRKW